MGLLSVGIQKLKKYYSKEEAELRRLIGIPRYNECRTNLLGGIILADSLSFAAGYQEIFKRENYKVDFQTSEPFIIDCGSNIGLSIIYFKTKFPKSTIIGFEPDPKIFNILKQNTLKFQQVILHNKAISKEKGKLSFVVEGGFSGRLNEGASDGNVIVVETEPLSFYINRKVDLLKIDIEGAEFEVLQEIQPRLELVEKIFIEYHSINGQNQNLDLILSILKKEGYRVHIKEAFTARHPFVEIPVVAGMDNQLEIYGSR
jgi:FkbM family methyltransferase